MTGNSRTSYRTPNHGRISLITVFVVVLVSLLIWYICSLKHFFADFYTVKRLDCGNGYTLVVSAENDPDSNQVYCQIFHNRKPATSRKWIGSFVPRPNKIPFEVVVTKDRQVAGLINGDHPEVCYALCDLSARTLNTYTETEWPIDIFRRLETDHPHTSKIIQSLKRLNQKTNDDAFVIFHVSPFRKAIQFANDGNGNIIFDFPVLSITREGILSQQILMGEYVSSLPDVHGPAERIVLMDDEELDRLTEVLDRFQLQYGWIFWAAKDDDGNICSALKSLSGHLNLPQHQYPAFIDAVITDVFQISINFQLYTREN